MKGEEDMRKVKIRREGYIAERMWRRKYKKNMALRLKCIGGEKTRRLKRLNTKRILK